MWKRLGLIGLTVTLFCIFIFRDLIYYGVQQAQGQWRVIQNSVELSEVLENPLVPDSIKSKIDLIGEIRSFAIDSLGLTDSENYQSYYEQNGKPILWMLTASPPFEIKAKEWHFPIVGSFPYKGFFNYQRALDEARKLSNEGYDTSIQEVAAWSTLGWFKDPILSSMLERNEKSLANLIIHELTHSTIFLKGEGEFNESLASFIGEKGAEAYLSFKYGENPFLRKDSILQSKRNKYIEIINSASIELSLLYSNTVGLDESKRYVMKEKKLAVIQKKLDSLYAKPSNRKLNNAHLSSFKTYRNQVNPFEEVYTKEYRNNLKLFIAAMKKKQHSD